MQRGSVLLILLIVVLVIASGVGVYFLQNSKTNLTSEAAAPIINKIVPTPSPQDRTINIDNIGLSLTVPSDVELVNETEEEYFKRANGNIRKNFNYYIQYDPPGFTESFYIMPRGETNLDKALISAVIYENPQNLMPIDFYDKYWYYPFVWGDFTSRSKDIAPENEETVDGRASGSGIVSYREGKPKFIYVPLKEKNLMMQIQLPTEENAIGETILKSFVFN